MTMISISQAREELAELVNRVAYGGERVVLGRHGKKLVAIIPARDLELFERLEDEVDLLAAREALADPENQGPPIPWEQVKADMHRPRPAPGRRAKPRSSTKRAPA